MDKRYRRCLVGGTFDRFHAGHRSILSTALDISDTVEVWVTSDSLASEKSTQIQSYDERIAKISIWGIQHGNDRMSIHELNDEFGPAPWRSDCDSIICTVETKNMCESINKMRKDAGHPMLEIIEVPHHLDVEGGVISSSRIRAGTIDSEGHSWTEAARLRLDLIMPIDLDKELKEPMGEVFLGPGETPEIAMHNLLESFDKFPVVLVGVGDITVQTMLDCGIRPDIALIDGCTKRTKLPEDERINIEGFDNYLDCVNPSGMLTLSLFETCQLAIVSDGNTLIQVDGEEDLAPLLLHLLLPLGSAVVYGQPNKGVVLRITDGKIKSRCREIIEQFTEV